MSLWLGCLVFLAGAALGYGYALFEVWVDRRSDNE